MSMRKAGGWGGRRAAEARRYCRDVYGYTCWLCGQQIMSEDDYTVDHIVERSVRPDLTWEPSNWRPAHGRKHPELNCPGNMGRSSLVRVEPPPTPVRAWTASGW